MGCDIAPKNLEFCRAHDAEQAAATPSAAVVVAAATEPSTTISYSLLDAKQQPPQRVYADKHPGADITLVVHLFCFAESRAELSAMCRAVALNARPGGSVICYSCAAWDAARCKARPATPHRASCENLPPTLAPRCHPVRFDKSVGAVCRHRRLLQVVRRDRVGVQAVGGPSRCPEHNRVQLQRLKPPALPPALHPHCLRTASGCPAVQHRATKFHEMSCFACN